MKDPYFIWCSDVSSADSSNVGKLAQDLSLLKGKDVPVQNFFVLSSKKFFDAVGPVLSEIQGIMNSCSLEDVDSISSASKQIQAMIDAYDFDDDFKNRLLENYRELERADSKYSELSDRARELIKSGRDLPTVTLRVSMDKHFCSYEAKINLKGVSEILQGIKEIWKDLFSVKSIYIMKKNDILVSDLNPGIIFQKTLLPSKSGDIFTSNPINSNNSQHYIQAHWGMNNDFLENVSVYVADKESGELISSMINKQEEFLTKKSLGSDKFVQKIPEKYQNASPLSEKEVRALSMVASKIASELDYPQHINWVVFDKKLIIVKTEPITNIFRKPVAFSGEVSDYIAKGIGITNMDAEGVYYRNFVFDQNAIFQVNRAKKSFDPYLILSSGIISKSSSISSYLAVSCQDLEVPCLLNADTSSLQEGQKIKIMGSYVIPSEEAYSGFSSEGFSQQEQFQSSYQGQEVSEQESEQGYSSVDEEGFSFDSDSGQSEEGSLQNYSLQPQQSLYSQQETEGSYVKKEYEADKEDEMTYSSGSDYDTGDEKEDVSFSTDDYEQDSEQEPEVITSERSMHLEQAEGLTSISDVAREVAGLERKINELVLKSAEKRRTQQVTEEDEKIARALSEAEWLIRDLKKKLNEVM